MFNCDWRRTTPSITRTLPIQMATMAPALSSATSIRSINLSILAPILNLAERFNSRASFISRCRIALPDIPFARPISQQINRKQRCFGSSSMANLHPRNGIKIIPFGEDSAAGYCDTSHETGLSTMSKSRSAVTHQFRVHLIRLHGHQSSPTLRVILVEATSAQAVYEGFGPWPECMRWIGELTSCGISGDELVLVQQLLDQKRLVTMKDEVRASLDALESLGLHRADSYPAAHSFAFPLSGDSS